METRHPVEKSFGNKFLSIYNRCGVMAAWSRKTLKNFNFFCVFLEKRPLTANFQNSVLKGFIATSIDVLCSNFVKFGRRKIGKIMRCLPDKKFAWLSSSRYCADRAQNLPEPAPRMYSECSRFHPNRFTFGRVMPERVNTVRARSKVNPIFGWSLALGRIKMQFAYKRTQNKYR